MRRFAELYRALDGTTKTNAKVEALAGYFRTAPREDAAWALYFLTGRRLLRLLGVNPLVAWTLELSGIPPWLLEESFGEVGDLAETIALLLEQPGRAPSPLPLHRWVEERILPLYDHPPEEQRRLVTGWWRELERTELYLLNKLLTGEMRVGVSHKLVVRGLARATGASEERLLERLMGPWEPTAAFLRDLNATSAPRSGTAPCPFSLASPLLESPETLGERDAWLVEWKWDGIRAQVVRRDELAIWSRGEDLVTERFPEVVAAATKLPPGTVLDGELLAWRGDRPLPFAVLQRRIGRKALGRKVLEEAPVVFVAFDLLEHEGRDVRLLPIEERRARLEALLANTTPGAALRASELVAGGSWPDLARIREESRRRGVEGFLLKRRGSPYRSGRRRGDWWKWKIDPYTVDCVLVHAQPGHGRRASVYTDYTFAIRAGETLVPIAKAYSGLSDDEIDEVDAWVRAHVVAKHGPVVTVEPALVFELAFEGIARSPRHRSGIAVRFPRIARWRRDKTAKDADTIETVKSLLPPEPPPPPTKGQQGFLFPV